MRKTRPGAVPRQKSLALQLIGFSLALIAPIASFRLAGLAAGSLMTALAPNRQHRMSVSMPGCGAVSSAGTALKASKPGGYLIPSTSRIE